VKKPAWERTPELFDAGFLARPSDLRGNCGGQDVVAREIARRPPCSKPVLDPGRRNAGQFEHGLAFLGYVCYEREKELKVYRREGPKVVESRMAANTNNQLYHSSCIVGRGLGIPVGAE